MVIEIGDLLGIQHVVDGDQNWRAWLWLSIRLKNSAKSEKLTLCKNITIASIPKNQFILDEGLEINRF